MAASTPAPSPLPPPLPPPRSLTLNIAASVATRCDNTPPPPPSGTSANALAARCTSSRRSASRSVVGVPFVGNVFSTAVMRASSLASPPAVAAALRTSSASFSNEPPRDAAAWSENTASDNRFERCDRSNAVPFTSYASFNAAVFIRISSKMVARCARSFTTASAAAADSAAACSSSRRVVFFSASAAASSARLSASSPALVSSAASAATLLSDFSTSDARASIVFAACSAATACSVRSAAVDDASSAACRFSLRSTSSANAFASSSAWYTMALYVPDHSLSSCERTRECVRRRARGREFRLKTREERTIPEEEAEEEKNVVRRFRRRRRRRPAATRPALRSRAKLSNARPRGRFVLAPRAGGRKGKGKGNDRRRRATHLDGAVEGAGHERGGRQRRGAVRRVVVVVALDGRRDVRVLRERAISRGGRRPRGRDRGVLPPGRRRLFFRGRRGRRGRRLLALLRLRGSLRREEHLRGFPEHLLVLLGDFFFELFFRRVFDDHDRRRRLLRRGRGAVPRRRRRGRRALARLAPALDRRGRILRPPPRAVVVRVVRQGPEREEEEQRHVRIASALLALARRRLVARADARLGGHRPTLMMPTPGREEPYGRPARDRRHRARSDRGRGGRRGAARERGDAAEQTPRGPRRRRHRSVRVASL
eukprot:30920-Pelagococcus_subviridis.AAC.32